MIELTVKENGAICSRASRGIDTSAGGALTAARVYARGVWSMIDMRPRATEAQLPFWNPAIIWCLVIRPVRPAEQAPGARPNIRTQTAHQVKIDLH